MKKLLIILISITLCEMAYSQNKTFNKLQKNEYLEYTFDSDNNSFHVFTVNKDTKKEIFNNIDTTSWGMYQISESKKKIVYWEEADNYMYFLNYIDGENGTIKNLGKLSLNSMMDSSGKYLLMDTEQTNVFKLMDLSTGKIIKSYEIPLKKMDNGLYESFTIYRSIDKPEYDFLLVLGHERLCSAKVYLNIKTDKIFIEFDETDKYEIEMRKKEKYGGKYLGWE